MERKWAAADMLASAMMLAACCMVSQVTYVNYVELSSSLVFPFRFECAELVASLRERYWERTTRSLTHLNLISSVQRFAHTGATDFVGHIKMKRAFHPFKPHAFARSPAEGSNVVAYQAKQGA